MRRKIKVLPDDYNDWAAYSVRTDIDKERLQLIGAICLEWNFIEDMLDYAMFYVWEMDHGSSVETASRINGMDGKFAILKYGIRIVKRHPDPIPAVLDKTIDALAEYKKFRDAVVHARLLRPDADVAYTNIRHGKADEVLVTNEALDGLLSRLEILSSEMVSMTRALAYTFIDDYGNYNPKPGPPEQAFQAEIAQVQEHQKRRQSLPPLPKFPPRRQVRSKSEEPE